jgi:hypothetical protein
MYYFTYFVSQFRLLFLALSLAAKILNKQSQRDDGRGPRAWGWAGDRHLLTVNTSTNSYEILHSVSKR